MRRRVFVDTGGWVAVTVAADRFHVSADAALRQLLAERAHLVVSDYVIAETATFLRYEAGHRAAKTFLEIVDRSLEIESVAMARVESRDFAEARKIFDGYADQDFSYTDCTSFALARRLRIASVFGYDHHFTVMGFTLIG